MRKLKIYINGRETLEIANKRLIKIRAEHFKKAGSTHSDAPIETLMICTYCRKEYLLDNKNKDPETIVPSTKEFNKNLFIHGAISYQVKSFNSHFESESKKATNLLSCNSVDKNLQIYMRLKKMALKVSEHLFRNFKNNFFCKHIQTTASKEF